MARYGRGGKRWIRYDTAQNIAIWYDTIYGPKTLCRMVNSPRLMQRSHWRLHTRSHACKRHQRSLTTFELCPYCRTPLTTFNACKREDGLIALPDFSSVFTDVRTSLTTFERQWEVHLRLHSSTPSQRICGRRPGTACIWVWPHTGWTTTLVPTTDAWQSRLAPGSHTADFIWRHSATVIRKGIGLMNLCIIEPATAFQGGWRCLNKHQRSKPGNYWHYALSQGLSNALADIGMWN